MPDNALARLIAEKRDASGDSYGAIAERGGLPRSTVHKLATADLMAPPKPETLEKLAEGLSIPVEIVTRAAHEATGYQLYEGRTPDAGTQLLIANIEQLDDGQRAAVSALVERLLQLHA